MKITIVFSFSYKLRHTKSPKKQNYLFTAQNTVYFSKHVKALVSKYKKLEQNKRQGIHVVINSLLYGLRFLFSKKKVTYTIRIIFILYKSQLISIKLIFELI